MLHKLQPKTYEKRYHTHCNDGINQFGCLQQSTQSEDYGDAEAPEVAIDSACMKANAGKYMTYDGKDLSHLMPTELWNVRIQGIIMIHGMS